MGACVVRECACVEKIRKEGKTNIFSFFFFGNLKILVNLLIVILRMISERERERGRDPQGEKKERSFAELLKQKLSSFI